MFSQEEIINFKRQPDNIDIHCSFPSKWEKEKGEKWMQSHVKIIVNERNKIHSKKPPMMNIPKNVISDDAIKELLAKSKPTSEPVMLDFVSNLKQDNNPEKVKK
jgi:hypothetical protein